MQHCILSKLGGWRYKPTDIADAWGEKLQTLGPRQTQIINKGMIWGTSHGEVHFTVPMFNEYLIRHFSAFLKRSLS